MEKNKRYIKETQEATGSGIVRVVQQMKDEIGMRASCVLFRSCGELQSIIIGVYVNSVYHNTAV